MIPLTVFIFLSIQLLFVAYADLKTRTISNFWILINVAVYVLLLVIFPKVYSFNLNTFIFPLAFFVVGFVLFFLKIMGGGDSKYLSSMFLLVPVDFQDTTFIYLLYTTILVGSTLIVFNVLKNFDKIIFMARMYDISGIKRIFGKKFTYAPVIFIAWMWFGWQNRLVIY